MVNFNVKKPNMVNLQIYWSLFLVFSGQASNGHN